MQKIKNKILFTKHGREMCEVRGISKNDLARTIKHGLVRFAGDRRMKVTHRGVCVIYENDKYNNHIIITAYKYKAANRKTPSIYTLLKQISN